ncbi:FAD-dependent oxidoreductase [Pelagibius sp. Alg239-R121]|uniref:FAD-dependent oxidoreductase n=1 Tax=Pelagibius sp. Alg239-R121 TaxID=2993448 RepID=UPI0024A7A10E|nr:FAD-dependent oxidoreductase [Pelagibius sp. Alg239-R121]
MRILICGGGISGLSTALALRGDGHEIELIEKADGWRAEGAGLHLPGNAVASMERLGIAGQVAAISFAFPRIRYLDHRAARLFDLDLRDGSWPVFQATERAGFHEILRRALPDLKVIFGREISEISTSDKSAKNPAAVTFNDGDRSEYDLVVGADGINSSLRALLWGKELAPVSAGFSCWRWLTPLPPGQAEPHFMIGSGSVLLVMPVSADCAYVFASIADPDGTMVKQGADILQSAFSMYGGAVPKLLARLEQDAPILPGVLAQMLVDQWHQGPAVLVGDAAHGTLPTMAQGATMAMEDALVLAESLRAEPDLHLALSLYQERRKPRAQWVQHQSLKRMGLARLKSQPLVFLRNQLMRRMGPKVLASGWRPLIEKAF